MRRASVARNDSPILLRLSGIILALVVFTIDTFTPIESAIAVLYVLVMLMVSGTLGQRGICTVSAGCAFLTIVSFLISHGFVADLPTGLRLGVCLAAIITIRPVVRSSSFSYHFTGRVPDMPTRRKDVGDAPRVLIVDDDCSFRGIVGVTTCQSVGILP